MAAASADVTFWAFVWYVQHNPFKSVDAMTETDFQNLANAYALENSDTLTATDPGTYTNVVYPGAVTASNTEAVTNQCDYPEKHMPIAAIGG